MSKSEFQRNVKRTACQVGRVTPVRAIVSAGPDASGPALLTLRAMRVVVEAVVSTACLGLGERTRLECR